MDKRKNRIAQWAFDTRPILGRFHLWLDDVDIEWVRGDGTQSLHDSISFVDESMERLFTMTAAVTALGTKLFGRFGEGKSADKQELNQVKKDADAISAYAMSESLWYLSRSLPENHAIMVCLGEGMMPKGGETPEMGSNPMLGFGRIYARPQVAKFLETQVLKLINDDDFKWDDFRQEVNKAGVTIWGSAIDTLENTSRFAKGKDTGPMTVLHIFDQPLAVTRSYEGYIGNLVIPGAIARRAEEESLLINFNTPRSKIVEAIRLTYPDIQNANIHVWTLRGPSRESRIGVLWDEWENLGVHLVDENWTLPSGYQPFVDSGTYAPSFLVRSWKEKGVRHLFLVDGYAASAEAIQAASLSPIFDLDVSLAVFSSKFSLSYEKESRIMHVDPDDPHFEEKLVGIAGRKLEKHEIKRVRSDIRLARSAGIPLDKPVVYIDDFLPEKKWSVMALSGYMEADPYTGAPGIEQVDGNAYRVTVRLSTRQGDKKVTLTLRLLESFEESRLVFNPLLNRFLRGEDYTTRPVKISDSGRIRNELQTLCGAALEYSGKEKIKLCYNKISPDVISLPNQKKLRQILSWYKKHHPIWFSWLEQE
ncbi:hypothetical protein JXO52_04355 [bacterium]|nr:hypothetical protein [bacterium]